MKYEILNSMNVFSLKIIIMDINFFGNY